VLGRIWRKGNPPALLVGMQISAATRESSWNFLKKLKMELPFDLAILVLEIYQKKPKTLVQNNMCTPMLIALLFTITKI
jgi:hypothetical protein